MVPDQGVNNLKANSDMCITVIHYTKCYNGNRRVRNTFNRRRKQPKNASQKKSDFSFSQSFVIQKMKKGYCRQREKGLGVEY